MTDVGELEDKSFNEGGWCGTIAGATSVGGSAEVIVTADPADYAANIQTFIDQGYKIIVTYGFALGNATTIAALENPDVWFIGLDQPVCVDEAGAPDPTFTCAGDAATLLPNYQGLIFNEAQAGYLAGIVAATITETGVIGTIGGIESIPAVKLYIGGYHNGALSVNPDIEVLISYVSEDITVAFNDPATGASLAEQMIGQDADVIFQVAGLSGQGALEASCDAGHLRHRRRRRPGARAAERDLHRHQRREEARRRDRRGDPARGRRDRGRRAASCSTPPPIRRRSAPRRSTTIPTCSPPELQTLLDDATAAMASGELDPCEGEGECPDSTERADSAQIGLSRQATMKGGSSAGPPFDQSPRGSRMTEIVSQPVHVPALEMRGVTKRYPGVLANDHIDLDIRPGEIHALLGENGAGKSTLMNILYGLATPDEGEILLDGEPVTIHSPSDAIDRGISMVHQHFMLVPVLSVAENILLGDEPMANPIFLDRRDAHDRIRTLGDQFGFEVDPDAKVGSLSVGWQQRVEILKALYRSASILVLDEPTAVLTPQETREIFAVLRQLTKELGTSVIFISHKLYEVLEIADRITVIRRGKVVGQRVPSETNEEDLAELMVGRDVQLTVDRGESTPGEVMLTADQLRVADDRGHEVVHGVSFEVRAGRDLRDRRRGGQRPGRAGRGDHGAAAQDLRPGDARRQGHHACLAARPPRQRRRLRAGRSASVRPRAVLPDHRQHRAQRLPLRALLARARA